MLGGDQYRICLGMQNTGMLWKQLLSVVDRQEMMIAGCKACPSFAIKLLTDMDGLPPELLERIFSAGNTDVKSSLVLLQVSRAFYSVALPQLWAVIDMEALMCAATCLLLSLLCTH